MITCGACGATWTAQMACHCSGCHQLFSGISLFDRHRDQYGPRGSCTDPATIKDPGGKPAMRLVDGMWRGPEKTDSALARLIGSDPERAAS